MRDLYRFVLVVPFVFALGFTSAASANMYDVDNKVFLSTSKAGRSAKIKLDFSHGWAGVDPGYPFPGVSKLHIAMPKGAKLNAGIAEECDIETLEETYGEGCALDSKLGTGWGTIDARECNLGLLGIDIDVYKISRKHGEKMSVGFIGHQPDSGARIIYKFGFKKERGRYVFMADGFSLPPILSCRLVLVRGVFDINVTKRVKIKVRKSGKKRKRWVRQAIVQLPKRCKKDKIWMFVSTETFVDGQTIVRDIPIKCKK